MWISGTSLCDGINNCGDWLDEKYCVTSRGFSCRDVNGKFMKVTSRGFSCRDVNGKFMKVHLVFD